MTRALHNSFFEERSQLLEELVYYIWNIVVLVVNDSHLRSTTMLFLVVCSVLECKHRLVPNIINPFIICGPVYRQNTDVVDINGCRLSSP